MKTKMYASLLALAGVVSIGFPAAAEEASGEPSSQVSARSVYSDHMRPVSGLAPVRSQPLGSGGFATLAFARTHALSPSELDGIRGAALFGGGYSFRLNAWGPLSGTSTGNGFTTLR